MKKYVLYNWTGVLYARNTVIVPKAGTTVGLKNAPAATFLVSFDGGTDDHQPCGQARYRLLH